MTIDYTTLESDLDKADCDFTAAFTHGLLSAYCCTNNQNNDWALIIFSDLDKMNVSQQETIKTLTQLKAHLTEQLADSELGYQLLTDTSSDLSAQVLSTREWTSGFWLGLQRSELKKIDESSLEFIKDLSAIAAMPIPEDNDEANLTDLMEIQEYCRMGVISLYLTQHKESGN